MICLQFCGPSYNVEGDLCGLEEGHRGPCMPQGPVLRHGQACAYGGQSVGGDGPTLGADLCICDPHGDKARAWERSWERYRRSARWVLWQDEVWFQQDGTEVRVKDMGLRHMQNTVLMLERQAGRIKWGYELGLVLAPGVQGEHALDAVDAILGETMETDALVWLHGTPLVRRLDRRIRKQSRKALLRDFSA